MELVEVAYTSLVTVYSVFWLVCVLFYLHRRNMEPVKTRNRLWTTIMACGVLYANINQALRIAFPDLLSCGYRVIYAVFSITLVYLPALFRMEEIVFMYRWNKEKLIGVEGWYHRHRWMMDSKYEFIFYMFVTFLHFAVDLIIAYGTKVGYPSVSMADPDCKYSTMTTGQNAIGILYILWALFGLKRLYGPAIQDAYKIKGEVKLILCLVTPTYILYFIFVVSPIKGFDHRAIPFFNFFLMTVLTLCYPVYHSYIEEIEKKIAFKDQSPKGSLANETAPLVDFQLTRDGAVLGSSGSDHDLIEVVEEKGGAPGQMVEVVQRPSSASLGTGNVVVDIVAVDDPRDSATLSNGQKPVNKHTKKLMGAGDQLSDGRRRGSNSSQQNMSSVVTFQDILKHPVFLDAFAQFCVQSWCSENIAFYRQVSEMKLRHAKGFKYTNADLQQIVRDYLVLGASRQINIPDAVQKSVLAQINAGATDPSVLDPAFQSIYLLLKSDIYPRFRTSKLYQDARRAAV